MLLKVLLIISIIIQLVAAATAISMIKQTKFNLSWILFTIALTTMAMSRFTEYSIIAFSRENRIPEDIYVWIGIITSLCFAVGLLLVKRIFTYITRAENERRLTAQRILNTVIRTEERERKRFSKDLHDGLGPLLASAKLSISALDSLEQDQRCKSIIGNAAFVIDEALRTAKEVANNMSPHILNNFGIAVAIRKFIESLSLDSLTIDYQTNIKDERFKTDVETVIYRVTCELLHNTIRHSGASKVSISLMLSETTIEMSYADNGCGFDTTNHSFGIGLSEMESRVSTIGGAFKIMSSIEHGMKAEIVVNI